MFILIELKSKGDIVFEVDLIKKLNNLGLDRFFPETKKTLLQSSQLVEAEWKRTAVSLNVRNMKEYVDGIKTVKKSDLLYSVQSTSGVEVEKDIPSFDLKPGLLSGASVKQGKEGPYTTVPFTHKTESLKKAGVLEEARRIEQSVVTEQLSTRQRTYRWRGRLRGQIPDDRRLKKTPAGDYTWKAPSLKGMVRMKGDVGTKQKYSTYITFRRVSKHSSPASWWHPGFKGAPVRQTVLDNVKDRIKEMIKMALITDINEILATN